VKVEYARNFYKIYLPTETSALYSYSILTVWTVMEVM